ncbi:MAG: S10 family peptidase [archaeon]|nr:S10 family peptidase [archaeon]
METKIKTNLDLHACSSTNCDSQGCDYCAECSHAKYYDTGEDKNRKMWYWFFNPRNGPIFCNPVGKEYKRQPHEKSEAWTVFERWHKDNFQKVTEYKKGIF